MTAVDSTLVALALQYGRMSAVGMDVPAVLARLCTVLPSSVGVAGAVIMLAEPPDPTPTAVYASDATSAWIGEAQRRAGSGPLPNAIRSGRPMLTPDLTRIGPPEVAAAAAESGLTSSMVVPMVVGEERYGALQLLGEARRVVEPGHADAVRPLLEVLVARLVDVRALRSPTRRAAAPAVPAVAPVDVATTAIPVIHVPRPRGRHR